MNNLNILKSILDKQTLSETEKLNKLHNFINEISKQDLIKVNSSKHKCINYIRDSINDNWIKIDEFIGSYGWNGYNNGIEFYNKKDSKIDGDNMEILFTINLNMNKLEREISDNLVQIPIKINKNNFSRYYKKID
jgi:hypothetical protein